MKSVEVKNVRKDSPPGRGRNLRKTVRKVDKVDSVKKNVRNRDAAKPSRGATRGRGRPPTRGNKVRVFVYSTTQKILTFYTHSN